MNEHQQIIRDRLRQIDTDYLEAQEKSQNVIQNALQELDLDVTDFLTRLEAYSVEPKTGKTAANLAKFVLGSDGQWSKNEDVDYSPVEQALWRSGRQTKYEKFRLLSMLYRWVEVGNELKLWELPLPALPTYLPSPVCPYSPGTRDYWDRVDELRKVVIHSVKKNEPLGLEIEVGRYLLSFILFGNLLDAQVLRAAISSKLTLKKAGEHVWVDIPIMTSRHSEAEVRRWYPDPFSEYLIRHSTSETNRALTKLSRSKKFLKQVEKFVNLFLQESTYSNELTIKTRELFEIASHALALESSPMNASYAARKVITHSMRQSAWLRMLGASPITETEDQDKQGSDQAGKRRRSVAQDDGNGEDTLRLGLLTPSVSTELLALRRDVIDHKLEVRSIRDAEKPTVVELMQDWATYLMFEKKWFGRKPSPNTVASFISSFGQRLFRFAGDVNLLNLPEEGFEDIYWTILEDAESSSLKRKLSRAIKSFHEYLRYKFPEAVPTLQDAGSLKLGNTQIAVDANIINLDEYEKCKRRLLTHPDLMKKSFRICEIAALIFVIGFRVGTRRQEVLKLRLADLHISFLPELLIRPWAKRTLKTRASNRKIPLHALLSEEELEWLGDFWRRRRQEAGTSDPAAHLFADPGLKCPSSEHLSQIEGMMM